MTNFGLTALCTKDKEGESVVTVSSLPVTPLHDFQQERNEEDDSQQPEMEELLDQEMEDSPDQESP